MEALKQIQVFDEQTQKIIDFKYYVAESISNDERFHNGEITLDEYDSYAHYLSVKIKSLGMEVLEQEGLLSNSKN